MFSIGDMVRLPADKHNDDIYGYIIDEMDNRMPAAGEPLIMYHIEWFDGQKSYEFPQNIHKVQ